MAPVLSGGSSVVWRLWRVKHLCNGVWDRRISNDYLSDVNWNKAVNGDVHDLCDQCEYKVTQRSYLKNAKKISSWRGAGHLWSVRLLSNKYRTSQKTYGINSWRCGVLLCSVRLQAKWQAYSQKAYRICSWRCAGDQHDYGTKWKAGPKRHIDAVIVMCSTLVLGVITRQHSMGISNNI